MRCSLSARAGWLAASALLLAVSPARAQTAPTAPTGQHAVVVHVPPRQHPVRGVAGAPVNILYFAPWKSDATKNIQPLLAQLLKQFHGRIRLQFMNKPRDGSYYQAEWYAARAGRAVFTLGGDRLFWKFHDAVLALPSMYSLSDADVEQVLRSVGADPGRVRQLIQGGKPEAEVQAEAALGTRLSLPSYQSSPALLIGSQLLHVSQWTPYTTLEANVRSEVTRAQQLAASGLPAAALHAKQLEEAKGRYQPWRPYVGHPQPGLQGRAARRVALPVGASPAVGPATAWVTVVAFIDYSDYNSQYVWNGLEVAIKAHPKRLRVVFKLLPRSTYANALVGARAALAAHRQGKFLEMSRVLMQNRWRISPQTIGQLAQQAGLDVGRFSRDVVASATSQAVLEDVRLGRTVGLAQAPGVFINGRRLVSSYWNQVLFDQLLRSELKGGILSRVLGD
jgi:protein-disulfide isomerase